MKKLRAAAGALCVIALPRPRLDRFFLPTLTISMGFIVKDE
jgi:hypothetical protein